MMLFWLKWSKYSLFAWHIFSSIVFLQPQITETVTSRCKLKDPTFKTKALYNKSMIKTIHERQKLNKYKIKTFLKHTVHIKQHGTTSLLSNHISRDQLIPKAWQKRQIFSSDLKTITAFDSCLRSFRRSLLSLGETRAKARPPFEISFDHRMVKADLGLNLNDFEQVYGRSISITCKTIEVFKGFKFVLTFTSY